MKRAAAAGLALWLLGCAGPKPGEPPAVRLGVDACARCGMLVSDERFAAGYVDDEGRSVVFDDVGEFLAAADADPPLLRRGWVRDALTGRWLAADRAVFVKVEGLPTPMGSGYAAFADAGAAGRFVAVEQRHGPTSH